MAAIKNKNAKRRIRAKACEMCGYDLTQRDAAHIIDEEKGHGGPEDWNALGLCPNCHRVFDEKLRPRLFRALSNFGAKKLPESWSTSNKLGKKQTVKKQAAKK